MPNKTYADILGEKAHIDTPLTEYIEKKVPLKDDPNKLSGSNRNLYNTNYTKSQGGTTPPGGAVRNTNIPTA